jgi:maltose alpha-D-glucosyltransferase / alpha-amylase
MGVDALRMDAIPYLVERDGTSCENLPETHEAIKAIRAAIDEGYANRLILAEANQWPADVRPYFGDGDECHMAFHFPLMPRIYMALRQEDRLPITDIMAQTPAIPDNCQWGLFLRNHDELTLEMVTDDERDYMYFAYSADPRMRINVGIRRRLAPLVDNNRRRIELLNSLLLSFPGTPIMYYGDELGMGDNIYLGDRNGVRTPMQWNSDRNAGFSKCDPARLYFPVVMDPIYGYQVVNVEAQLSDQSSLLHWTRNMIALRKLFQVFGRGTLRFLNPANRKILAYLRDLERADGTHETVLCVANLSRFAQPVSLDLADHTGLEPVEMLGYVPFPIITEAPYALTLAPYSFLWLELQPASAKPEPAAELLPETFVGMPEGAPVPIPDLAITEWSGLLSDGQAIFDTAIQYWLRKQRWFGAKSRTIQTTRVLNWVELPIAEASVGSGLAPRDRISAATPKPALFFIEVHYTDGTPDTYQLPLAISSGGAAEGIVVNYPDHVVATLTSGLVLHDAMSFEDVRSSLLTTIEQNITLPLTTADAFGTDDQARSSTIVPATPLPLDAQPMKAIQEPRNEGSVLPSTADALQQDSLNNTSAAIPPKSSKPGRMEGRASSAFTDRNRPNRLLSRVGSAEQSNTSILYGEELILKLFRRVQPGENPDVEIGRFLTEVAHYPHIAPLLGEISIIPADGEKTTVAMLQRLVANEGDGWRWFLDQLGIYLKDVSGLAAAPEVAPPSFGDERELPQEIKDLAPASLEAAALLGKRTGEMHLALATATENAAFAAEPLSSADLANDIRRIDAQINSTLEALKLKLSTLKDLAADDAALLLSRRINLFARAHSITSPEYAGLKIRIHGDYHLGQTLRTSAIDGQAGDFVLLDFEGEPARPLAERRQKQSPLKDVSGMLRSFSYVSHTGLDQYLTSNEVTQTSQVDSISGWTRLWQNSISSEFLRGYRETVAANPNLLPPPQQSQSLLAAYQLEKALYELLYELNNRPSWLRIPLTGILAL